MAYEEFDAYMSRHIAHVREHPGDDLISMLIADQPDVTDTWLLRTGMGLLVAGHETTACLGQSLARTELQVALEVLLRRLPALRLAVPVGELRRMEGLLVGGLSEVPVAW